MSNDNGQNDESTISSSSQKQGYSFNRNQKLSTDGSLPSSETTKVQVTPKKFLLRGKQRLERGDYRGAAEDFNQALRLDPKYVDAYHHRGHIRYFVGDYSGAIDNLTQVLLFNPQDAFAYFNRGLFRSSFNHRQAIQDYTQALQFKPLYAEAYFQRGKTRYNLGDTQGAIEDFNQAIKINANYAEAYGNRGIALSANGNKIGAIEDLQKAVNLYLDQGNMEKYQKALELIKKI